MISFVIIGRNEGWKLTKCLQSVYTTIKHNELKAYEVIYVDSKSSDDSIKRARQFENIKIISLTGVCNAAIGRNIGSKESIGDVLFFIDGDMEIIPKFLPLVYNENIGLTYPFVSGQVKRYYYNYDGDFLTNSFQFKNTLNDEYHYTTGGIFIVDRSLWLKMYGMDKNFRQGEDHDFALRLTKQGYPLLRKSAIIANHHTVEYINEKRMWRTILSGNVFYPNIFLLRKHFLNIYVYKGLLRANYTTLSLIFFFLTSLFTNSFLWLSGYPLFLTIKVFKNRRGDFVKDVELFLYYTIRDIFIICAFFILPMKKVKSESISYNLVG